MIADSERREVAARLREYASWDEDGELVGCTEFGESVLNLLDGETERECFNALADLIEPSCDRDALLALADEMGRVRSRCGFCIKEGECDWADETICLESRIDDYAQRIREALGAGS